MRESDKKGVRNFHSICSYIPLPKNSIMGDTAGTGVVWVGVGAGLGATGAGVGLPVMTVVVVVVVATQ